MRFLVACLCALLVSQATCMTNREFADLMLESAEDVEELYPGDEGFDDPDDDATELPGGPDDELDVEYLIIQTGLPEKMMSQLNYVLKKPFKDNTFKTLKSRASDTLKRSTLSKVEPEGSSNLGWFRRRRRSRRKPCPASCKCHSRRCHCCIKHTFRVNLICKKIRFTLKACVYVTYLKGVCVEMKLTLNGKTIFKKRISIRHPPRLCWGIPGFKWFARVCLQFYRVNTCRKSFCLRLEGRLNLLFKKFSVHLNIGCFRLGALSEKELAHMMNDTTALVNYLSDMDNTMVERSGDLFQADIESLPELMQYVEITEITDGDVTGDVKDADDLIIDQMEIDDLGNK